MSNYEATYCFSQKETSPRQSEQCTRPTQAHSRSYASIRGSRSYVHSPPALFNLCTKSTVKFCNPHGERINSQWLLSCFSVLIFLQPWAQVVWRHLVEAVDLLTESTPKQQCSSRNRSAKLLPTCGEEGRRLRLYIHK